MKKITFVYPAIGKKPGTPYIKTWKMEPLPIAVLAALTPPDIEIEFFDINTVALRDFVLFAASGENCVRHA